MDSLTYYTFSKHGCFIHFQLKPKRCQQSCSDNLSFRSAIALVWYRVILVIQVILKSNKKYSFCIACFFQQNWFLKMTSSTISEVQFSRVNVSIFRYYLQQEMQAVNFWCVIRQALLNVAFIAGRWSQWITALLQFFTQILFPRLKRLIGRNNFLDYSWILDWGDFFDKIRHGWIVGLKSI